MREDQKGSPSLFMGFCSVFRMCRSNFGFTTLLSCPVIHGDMHSGWKSPKNVSFTYTKIATNDFWQGEWNSNKPKVVKWDTLSEFSNTAIFRFIFSTPHTCFSDFLLLLCMLCFSLSCCWINTLPFLGIKSSKEKL